MAKNKAQETESTSKENVKTETVSKEEAEEMVVGLPEEQAMALVPIFQTIAPERADALLELVNNKVD